MKPTWLNLIMVIVLTVLITIGMLKFLDGVSISFIKKAQYTELLIMAQQSRERIAGLELQSGQRITQLEQMMGRVIQVHDNLDRILKEKKVIP